MDIEDLSKTQLLLLTILVNFVVAIATGVLTVSLLDQAPTTVTQTVNRIVDHTIETVTTQVPVGGGNQAPSTEDLLTSAIASNASRTVELRASSGGESLARGFYIVSTRGVLTTIPNLPKRVFVAFSDGTVVPADLSREDNAISFFSIASDETLPQVTSADFRSFSELKQGQTVITLMQDGSATTGIITKLDESGIHTNLPIAVPAGSVIMTLSGNIAGMRVPAGHFTSGDAMSAVLTAQ